MSLYYIISTTESKMFKEVTILKHELITLFICYYWFL